MDSDAAHLTTENQVQNPLEQVTMQITQNMLPNLNFMTTSFPLNDMSLNGQAAVLQSLQQLGAVPFFTQGGGQLLMQAGGVPVLLHPGFGGTIQQQIASTSQTGNSQMVAQTTDSVVETLRTSGLQIDSSLLQSLLQQQQQQFPLLNLSQLYAQQQNIELATNDQQDSNQTNDSSFNVVSSQAFLEPYNNTQLSGFTAPLAYTAASQSTPVSENSEYASAGSNINQKPPKKPLTPYMRFSKEMWPSIKRTNPDSSVCEVGAKIGQLWRELGADQKEQYNKQFSLDKVQYDEQMHKFLKSTGAKIPDTSKSRSKKKAVQSSAAPTAVSHQHKLQQQHSQASTGGVHADTASDQNGSLPTFSQVWASNQGGAMLLSADKLPDNSAPAEQLWAWQTVDSKAVHQQQQQAPSVLPMYNPLSIQGLASVSTTSSPWQEPTYATGSADGLEADKMTKENEEELVESGNNDIHAVRRPHYASSHVHFNSHAANPWSGLPVSVPYGEQKTGEPVVDRIQLLESELKHLRYAVREKVADIGKLKKQLSQAKHIITELQQQIVSYNHRDIDQSLLGSAEGVQAVNNVPVNGSEENMLAASSENAMLATSSDEVMLTTCSEEAMLTADSEEAMLADTENAMLAAGSEDAMLATSSEDAMLVSGAEEVMLAGPEETTLAGTEDPGPEDAMLDGTEEAIRADSSEEAVLATNSEANGFDESVPVAEHTAASSSDEISVTAAYAGAEHNERRNDVVLLSDLSGSREVAVSSADATEAQEVSSLSDASVGNSLESNVIAGGTGALVDEVVCDAEGDNLANVLVNNVAECSTIDNSNDPSTVEECQSAALINDEISSDSHNVAVIDMNAVTGNVL